MGPVARPGPQTSHFGFRFPVAVFARPSPRTAIVAGRMVRKGHPGAVPPSTDTRVRSVEAAVDPFHGDLAAARPFCIAKDGKHGLPAHLRALPATSHVAAHSV